MHSGNVYLSAFNWVILKYATIHNHPQPSTTTYNHLKLHPQPPPKTTFNYPQSSTITQKLPKKPKTCHKQWCYFTLDVNTETDVGFGSDMKQWCIYMCVCVCVFIFTIFWLSWLFVIVSITSNSSVKSNDFCLLKTWI